MKQQTKLNIQKTVILLAVYLVLRFLLPLVLPFFLAWATVGILVFLQEKIHIKLFALSICYLALFILLAGTACFFGCWLLYEPCRDLIPICRDYWIQFSKYLTWLPDLLSGHLAHTMPSVFSCAFGIFLYFISVLLFARDWERFLHLLEKLPFSPQLSRAGKRITHSIKGWFRAQCKIMFIVTLQCAAGYWLLRIPGAGLWAVLTGFLDSLPVFGTGTIFIPWIGIVLLRKDYLFALWLALLYFVTWITRELLEPRLLGEGLGLLPICFLISVITGLKLFGAAGLFTGPFGVLLVRELWKELEMSAPPESTSAPLSADEKIPF